MRKKYISEEEKIKCKAVIRVFQELYDKEDIIALVAEDYGIVVLQWYEKNYGFNQVTTLTDYKELYKYLLEQWWEYELFRRMEGTEWEEADYDTMFSKLGKKNQREFMEKRVFFWKLLLDNLLNSNV